MKISPDSVDDMYQFLLEQRQDGNEFVVFLRDDIVRGREDVTCLPSAYDAMEFCYENSTDVDRYDYLSVRSAYRVLGDATAKGDRSVGNEPLDIEMMVAAYHIRLEQQPSIDNIKDNNSMNQKNYEYLRDQVKFTGFGDGLEMELKDKMEQNAPTFQINHNTKFGDDDVAAVLHFKKSNESDNYFFNHYDLSVEQKNAKEAVNQTFYIGRENNYTLKEGYNLLCGRSVHKELNKLEKVGEGENVQYRPTDEKYNAWVKLNFKETDNAGNYKHQMYHENYGYDLNAVLHKHPIKEMGDEESRTRLLQSLEKGNRHSVTFIVDGKEAKRHIEANPQFKTINIYDGSMRRLRTNQKDDEGQGENQQNTAKQTRKAGQKQGAEDDGDSVPEDSNKRKQRKSRSI